MANPLDRTWYSTLVDDDGSGTTGTIWNKAAVDALLDSVDASLATVVDRTAGALANEIAVFSDADTIKGGTGIGALAGGSFILLTPPGADNGAISLSGSGAVGDPARGASLYVAGNQFGAPGFVSIQMGNAPGAAISFNRGGAVAMLQLLANGVVSLLDGQLLFPPTQKPSADPNCFDDYREVPWYPAVSGTGGGSGQVYGLREALAIKKGSDVFTSGRVQLATMGTISGQLLITGFPFAHRALNYHTMGHVSGGLNVPVASLSLLMLTGTTTAQVSYFPAGGAVYPVAVTQAVLGAGIDISFAVSYPAAT